MWLARSGRRYWYTLVPMIFVMTITLWALGLQAAVGARDALRGQWRTAAGDLNPTVLNAAVAVLLLLLAAAFIREAWRAVRGRGAG